MAAGLAMTLVLASASPQRQRLLAEAGFSFEVQASDVDESDVPPGLSPSGLAEHLAVRKAEAVAAGRPGDVVLGADTVVSVADEVLGKPADIDDARRMLTLLGGARHAVITGIAVVAAGRIESASDEAHVQMRPLTADEMTDYLATSAWQGKAGGYGLQHDDPFVEAVEGRRDTIIGLPIPLVGRLLAAAGFDNRVE